jgi:methylated-DNA-protein-cysteine methyltransferase-like protein
VRGHRQPEPLKTDPILRAVRAIPRGRVATYGQIARLAGLGGQARRVGYALAALPSGSRVPWHRVVNAAGRISVRSGDRSVEMLQRRMLEREGVRFDVAPARPATESRRRAKYSPSGADTNRIDLARFRWRPRAYSSASARRGTSAAQTSRRGTEEDA